MTKKTKPKSPAKTKRYYGFYAIITDEVYIFDTMQRAIEDHRRFSKGFNCPLGPIFPIDAPMPRGEK